MIKNVVYKFCHMIRRTLVIFIDINPVKSCTQFNDLYQQNADKSSSYFIHCNQCQSCFCGHTIYANKIIHNGHYHQHYCMSWSKSDCLGFSSCKRCGPVHSPSNTSFSHPPPSQFFRVASLPHQILHTFKTSLSSVTHPHSVSRV